MFYVDVLWLYWYVFYYYFRYKWQLLGFNPKPFEHETCLLAVRPPWFVEYSLRREETQLPKRRVSLNIIWKGVSAFKVMLHWYVLLINRNVFVWENERGIEKRAGQSVCNYYANHFYALFLVIIQIVVSCCPHQLSSILLNSSNVTTSVQFKL
jgi:hypothetical protein